MSAIQTPTGQKVKSAVKLSASILFGLFVIVNAAYSQVLPQLYFLGLKDEKDTAVSYLKSIQSRPEFAPELIRLMNSYGPPVKEGVFYDDSMRNNYIKELEQLSLKNPSSPDINYQLSLLYKELGEREKSLEYLQRARAIDPAL